MQWDRDLMSGSCGLQSRRAASGRLGDPLASAHHAQLPASLTAQSCRDADGQC